jgi:flagellar hook protein FlgE
MALSSALFSATSGLSTLGNAMQVIGDNIANVNTVGFKSSSFTFQDLLSQSISTRAGTSQVGRGTALSNIQANFAQGSLESTGNTTDLAIGGEGFFELRESGGDQLFYTRAGNFHFDNDGKLVNPEGYVAQGWEVDQDGQIAGSTKDIALNSFTSQPDPTKNITVITNLDKDSVSKASILSSQWNGTASPPLAASDCAYQTTVKAYDGLGATHDITTYYDKISDSGSDWEYIVTCNPSEDKRAGITGTQGAGLLARGTISFSESDGTIKDLSMARMATYTDANKQSVQINGVGGGRLATTDVAVTVNNSQALTTANVGAGQTTLTYGATGWTLAGAGTILAGSTSTKLSIDLNNDAKADISLDVNKAAVSGDSVVLGLTGSNDWVAQSTSNIDKDGYYECKADFIGGTDADTSQMLALNIGTKFNGTTQVPDSLASTQFASASTTKFQSADGYGAGALQGVDVGTDGLITGSYSNGQKLPLYRIALAKFQSISNLKKEGGNIYSETRLSGQATTGLPGTNGLGSIAPNSLEQSNVDIANEFVKMITTQRGFQANSKMITVTDDMLNELISLKR